MDATDQSCSCGEARGLERVRYFPRQLLTADDMRAEQEYARQRQRRFNRFVIGWGVVCGLEVKPDPDSAGGVVVCPGYALGPWGDEIYVPESTRAAFGRRLAAPLEPCEPTGSSSGSTGEAPAPKTLFVAIRYEECLARPVRTSPAGCGCDDTACEYSRLRDGFQIDFLRALPSSHAPSSEDTLCALVQGQEVIPCPPCPKDPWVVLATVTFTDLSGGGTTSTFTIDCTKDRRVVVSATRTQAQVLQLCRDNQ